ncbi:DUF3145 domain-containing protein [Rarobacter incanus]|uniref:Uncharacterized protein DUF3145 n=1 Tax=Rarobacter incanus TaxID=153494 RepID=A0A542SMR4_9MICO|nr:DUF3145 domain-containing protein [Rarobacter incanus]TQK75920.1 uncharacterized protein DUF3145 [Rarobacter incanus]
MAGILTRGVVFVHSSPRALCPHLEWAASNLLGYSVHFDWTDQPAEPGSMRAELSWRAEQGTGAKLASAMRGWAHLRYEITEDPSANCDGGRWSHTPELGIFHTPIDVAGNAVIPEDRIRSAMSHAQDPRRMKAELDLALGTAWDAELEPFRHAGAGAPVRWLHRVG